MPEFALDQGTYFPSPLTGWYRERPFKVALVGSLLVHAALLAFVPGFRSVAIDLPKVLDVEIVKQEQPQPVAPVPVRRQAEPRPETEVVQPPPVVEPAPPPPTVEQVVEKVVEQAVIPPKRVELQPEVRVRQPDPVVRPPEPVARAPEPVVRQPVPDAPPVPRAEIIQAIPRPDIRPDPVVVPKPEPWPTPAVEPRPQPRAEIRPEIPLPSAAPPQQVPAVQPQVVAAAPVQREAPQPVVPQSVVQPPPVPAPAPVARAPEPAQPARTPEPAQAARTEPAPERGLVNSYEKSLADLIKRHEKYPDRARRQGWQGTAVVGLSLSADGKVKGISIIESSGREILDEAALSMVRRASPLPPAPEGLRGRERTVRVPIVFKLQDS